MASALVPPATGTGENPEFELKFAMANPDARALLAWMRATCRPHAAFPAAEISSIYYDYPDWRLLDAKVNSTYLKCKVRLRWYADSATGRKSDDSWLEVKQKVGGQRKKIRIPTGIPGTEVERLPLESPRLTTILAALHARGFVETTGLSPAFQITYTRRRFSHPASGCVFCVDHDIHVPRVNRVIFRHANPGLLPAAVLEQKGPLDRLNPVLDFVPHFHLKKGAFSKYGRCYRHITDP